MWMDFTELFVKIDDFWKNLDHFYAQKLIEGGTRQRNRLGKLRISEIMTLLIAFQTSGYRTFKGFYGYVLAHHRRDFPDLVGYDRFVYLIPRAVAPLMVYLQAKGFDQSTGIAFIDSTALKVCHHKRISRHRVFDGIAQIGKTTMGWFLGFKLHLIINDRGGLLNCRLTPGNVDDRSVVKKMTEGLFGNSLVIMVMSVKVCLNRSWPRVSNS
jgi:hypothetical protein